MAKDNKLYIQVLKAVAIIVLTMIAMRITSGGASIVVALVGVVAALSGRVGLAICCYIMLPACININPILLPKGGMMWNIGLRFGPLAIACALVAGAVRRRGNNTLPFAGILPFLGVAIISSTVGYVPQISYLKIINYFLFLIGIWLGTRNLQESPRDLEMIRVILMAIVFLLVWGSLLVIPIPAISYATSLQWVMAAEGLDAANIVGKQMLAEGGKTLFCGIMNHSQALSPILALSMAWLLCDMLFVEKRIRLPHCITIFAMLPMLYMTRSRVALLTGAAAIFLISVYTVNRIQVAAKVKSALRNGMIAFSLLAIVGAGIAEVHDHAMSKWLRKTDDLAADDRQLGEAFTGSRQGLIEQSMYDFRRNPMFGSGFQVSWDHQELYRRSSGLILSASIEKGVLPIMVLGETGIAGSIAFVFFLISFYVTSARKRLYVTITMFTLLLVSNMGEASFFSPGGIGSVLWILTVVGGFLIDTILKSERNQNRGYLCAYYR